MGVLPKLRLCCQLLASRLVSLSDMPHPFMPKMGESNFNEWLTFERSVQRKSLLHFDGDLVLLYRSDFELIRKVRRQES
jgi:hypothetical protein